ncbi:MAG: selenite/tellurite reduction operon rhodanese-like protein ExtH [Thermodesulfovibrionales bacterium]
MKRKGFFSSFGADGRRLVLLLAFALLVPLVLGGCGGDGYNSPSTATGSSIVSPATLKAWIDSGKVNGTGYDRVVILDVTTPASYGAGHIPGAQLVDRSTVNATRSDGVIPAVNMVLDGPSIDSIIQAAGIDGNTTIVITGPGAGLTDYMYAGRLYFNLRYWGFPKERIKVLNGMNGAYNAAYGLTVGGGTAPAAPSSWSVRNNPSFRDDLRASMAEMMEVAKGNVPGAVVIDGRGSGGSYAGVPRSTAGVFAPGGDFVAFEGHIKGGRAMSYTDLYVGVDTDVPADGVADYYELLGAEAMADLLTTETGLTSADTAYVHCRTAMISSAMFIAMDGLLGWPTVNYDGSWSEWGSLAGTSNGGYLDDNSPWRADTPALTDALTLNIADGATIEDPSTGGAVNPFSNTGSKVEIDDRAYYESGGGGGGGGAAPGY